MRRILKYASVLLVLELLACIGIFAPVQAACYIYHISPTGVGTTSLSAAPDLAVANDPITVSL